MQIRGDFFEDLMHLDTATTLRGVMMVRGVHDMHRDRVSSHRKDFSLGGIRSERGTSVRFFTYM